MRFAFAAAAREQPCIRCGDCATACPQQLDPQRLLLRLRDGLLAQAQREGALDCTECGLCEAACPSRIPLVARYREAKQLITATGERQRIALAARDRHRARQMRLSQQQQARSERQSERAASATSTDAVAAAIARAQARRAAQRGEPKA